MKKPVVLYLFIMILAISCQKDEAPLSEVPKIALKQAGPSVINANTDSVYFVLFYEDGDGDLGSTAPDSENLFVEDTRIGLIYKYRIQQLVPGGSEVGIQGELHFSIANTVITGSGTQEEVTYTLWVKDAAGHESNRVNAGPFTVVE